MDETPNLHLSLVGDTDAQENWRKIDAVAGAISTANIIPGDIEILGALTVDGATSLQALTVNALLNALANVNVAGQLSGAGAIFSSLNVTLGPVTLPPGAVSPAALVPNFATRAWATTQSTNLSITATPQLVASVLMPAAANATNLELLIAEMICECYSPGGAAAQVNVQCELRYGGTTGLDGVVQTTRTYSVGSPTSGDIFSIPIVIPRFAVPPNNTAPHRWALGAFTVSGTGAWTVTATLVNLTVIQLG